MPSHTVYDVDCPDHTFRKFSNDGQYLICFSRNQQDLIVYRHNWLSYCRKGDDCDTVDELPPKSRKFDTYFTQLYAVSLASGNEVVCKEFFLTTENNLFGIFATSTAPDYSAAPSPGAVPGVPSIEKISISLVRYFSATPGGGNASVARTSSGRVTHGQMHSSDRQII